MKNLGKAIALIGKEQRKMRGDVAERPDAEHAAHIDQVAVTDDTAERAYLQRHSKKHERPETGAMNEFAERARAVRNLARLEYRLGERSKQQCKRDEAQDRHTTAPVAPQLPRMDRRIAHRAHIRHRPAKTRKHTRTQL